MDKLTPQDIQQLNKIFGTNVQSNNGTPVQSFADEIRAAGVKATNAKVTKEQKKNNPGEIAPTFKASMGGAESIIPNTLKILGNIPSDVAGTVGAGIITPAKEINQSIQTAGDIFKDRGVVQGSKDIAEGVGNTAKNIFEAPGKTIVGANDKMDLINHLAPLQEEALKQRDTILQKIEDAKKTGKDTTHLVSALKYVQESLSSLNEQIGSKEDRNNQSVDALTNEAKYPIEHPIQTGIAAETLPNETKNAIFDTVKPVTSTVENGVNTVKNAVSDVGNSVKNTIDSVTGKASNLVKGKAEAEILATPKDQVYKLSPSDRKVWFDNEQAKISSQADTATQKIKSDLKTQADQTTQATIDLQKQLATASRDKVIELRPKIVQAMGQQSKIYRGLIDEEMAGKKNVPVKIDDLKTHIDSQYGDNPALATAIKEKLGLTETPEVLKKGQLPTIQSNASTKTLGELYDQTKSLKQDISSGAIKGSKVFTSSDKLTDDAIHTLIDFMKKQGVDFSEANSFWSKYAPIRNQLVTEAKPFLQTGTQTKTFANTLMRVAKGTDVNNENFINQVEDLVGSPINDENKAIVQKLNETEKIELANKMQAESKLVDAQMAKDKALSKLSSEKFEIERQAKLRAVLKKVLKVGVGAFLGHTVGGVGGEAAGGVLGGAL